MVLFMFSLEIECNPEDRDRFIADLWEMGSVGIVELSQERLRAFFEDSADRTELLRRFPHAAVQREEARDWVQSARDLFPPMEVGKRFYLVPEWRDDPAPPGRFRIKVNPGMAFGTGVHESTRLCIEALEDVLRPGMHLLDVGTGSGILAKAASLLGAGRVYACDIDPVAVAIAGIGFVGSVDAAASSCADVVTANISPEVIVAAAPDLFRVLRPNGVLLASGFEVHEIAQMKSALGDASEVRTKGNWALIAVRRS